MQTWLMLALGYAFLHALVSVLDKRILANHKIDVIVLSTIRYAVNVVFAYLFLLALAIPVSGGLNIYVGIISALYFFAGITYFYALRFGEVSKLIPYRDAIVVLLSFFLAVFLLSETFAFRDFIGVIVIVLGGYIVWTDGKIIVPKKSPGLFLIAASAVFLSFNNIAVKAIIREISPIRLSFFMYSLVALYFVAVSLATKRREIADTVNALVSEKKFIGLIFAASFVATLGVVFQFYALSMQAAAKVLPASGTLPLFAALIGWIALNEKHGFARVIGAVLLIAGVYILQTP